MTSMLDLPVPADPASSSPPANVLLSLLADQPALAEVNPLVDLPLLGPIVGHADAIAANMDMPLWLREIIEFALVAMVTYLALRLLVRQLLPWAGKHLVDPTIAFIGMLRVIFLLPDLAVARVMRRLDRRPPDLAYFYGNSVLTVADVLGKIARGSLPSLTQTRRIPRYALILALVAVFFVWNNEVCVPSGDTACISPVDHWAEAYRLGR